MTIQQTIAREAARRELSGYALSKLTGIHARSLERFLKGEMDLSSKRLDRLCKVLDLSLQPTKRAGNAKGGK